MSKVIQYQSGMSNGYFVIENDSVIAVDAGALYGKEYAEKVCADAGIDPRSIRLIVASHAHVDHICNVDELRKLSGAPIAVQKGGEQDMRKGELPHVYPRCAIGDEIFEFAKTQGGMPKDYQPCIAPDIVWTDELDLHPYGISGKAVATPGHSLSDCSVILEDGQAIVGDLIVEDNFTHGAPTIAYFGYDPDRNKANEMLFPSLEKLASYNSVTYYSGHGGPFTRKQFEDAFARAKEEAAQ